LSPYSQSRAHKDPKLEKENHEDYEERTWRSKAHLDKRGQMVIPTGALKQALDSAVKKLGMQIPGKGKATYTKHFLAGVVLLEPVQTGKSGDAIYGNTIHANADGVRGSGKRVYRTFPTISEWAGTATFYILDEAITEPVFEKALFEAGKLVGIGQYRPEKGGYFGRFVVVGKPVWTTE
jgi:hypothetical protein